MDYGIRDKAALIVGGSKGMGFEVAKMLAAEGCRLAVLARTKKDVDAAVEALRADGGEAVGVCADVSQQQQIEDAVRQVSDEIGAPLIVIGQAIYQRPGDFADINDLNLYRESFEAYTMSQIFLLKAVLPAMQEAGWGRFVHIGSATAKEPAGYLHHVVANATRPSTIGLLKNGVRRICPIRHHGQHRGSGLDRNRQRHRLHRTKHRSGHRRPTTQIHVG